MNVKLEQGTAKVPLWAAITMVVTILLASVGWVVAANARASDAEHMAIWNSVKAIERSIDEMRTDIKNLLGQRIGYSP
jgi:hypothetical protein